MRKSTLNPDQSHVTRRACKEIHEIVEPMRELFGINSFTYQCVYHHGTLLSLSSHHDWTEYFWTHDCQKVVDGIPYVGFRKILIDPYIAPESPYWQQIIKPAQELFDLSHYVIFLRSHLTYTEVFIFTFPKENAMYETMVHDYPPIVNKFIFYFKDQAKKFIVEHKKQPLRWSVKPGTRVKYSVDKRFLSERKISKYVKKMSNARYYLGGNFESVYLTSRELDYLKLVSDDFPTKVIADRLHVSTRTAEKYINVLKEKLSCFSKKKLVNLAVKLVAEYELNSQSGRDFIDEKLKNDPESRKKIEEIMGCRLDDISFYE